MSMRISLWRGAILLLHSIFMMLSPLILPILGVHPDFRTLQAVNGFVWIALLIWILNGRSDRMNG